MDPSLPRDLAPAYDESPAFVPPRPAWATQADKANFLPWAFYGGLVAGVLILVCAFASALLLTILGVMAPEALPWFDADEVDDAGWFPGLPLALALWGLVTGGAVLLAALRVKEAPERSAMPGLVMAAGGLLSFFALGGFLVGGLLAIVAGVLAVAGARSIVLVRGPRVRAERAPPV